MTLNIINSIINKSEFITALLLVATALITITIKLKPRGEIGCLNTWKY